jgi:hypothetical protein
MKRLLRFAVRVVVLLVVFVVAIAATAWMLVNRRADRSWTVRTPVAAVPASNADAVAHWREDEAAALITAGS